MHKFANKIRHYFALLDGLRWGSRFGLLGERLLIRVRIGAGDGTAGARVLVRYGLLTLRLRRRLALPFARARFRARLGFLNPLCTTVRKNM